MPRLFRSSRLACFTLAAFLIAQPAVGCAVLCLLEHHYAAHEMGGMNRSSASSPVACHTGVGSATGHTPLQTLSPMEPAQEPSLRQVAVVPAEAPEARPAPTPQAHPSVDPPPPRFV
jgi:hypothetical protein